MKDFYLRFQLLVKRFFDFFGSLILIFFLSPLLIIIAIFIKLDSPGPAIFKQKRKGYHNADFEIYKFRSMYIQQDDVFIAASVEDQRITKIGKFLRKTSIDELPQLINVLIGNMSLVGPRPHAKEMDEMLRKKICSYEHRANVKPGMTGLAQIKGLRGGDNMEKLKLRIKYDLLYIKEWSLFLDVKILIMTIPALINTKAY